MVKLRHYLKPFIGLIILSMGLLYLQAKAELALPDYLSRIVNVGIQQGGNEEAMPKVLIESDYQAITLFLAADNQTTVATLYEAISPTEPDYQALAEDYPDNQGQTYYRLTKPTDQIELQTATAFSKALVTYYGLIQAKESGQPIEIDGRSLPVGIDSLAMLSQMPGTQRLMIVEKINQKFTAIGPTMLHQAATRATLGLYQSMGAKVDRMRQDYILNTGLVMLLITLLSAVASITVSFLASKVSAGVGRNLRADLFQKISYFSNSEFDTFSTASLITRSTNDVIQVQTLIAMMMRIIFYAPILGIGGILRAVDKSPSMSWIIAGAVVLLLILIGGIFGLAVPRFKKIQKLVDRVNQVVREQLSGMMVVRAFNTQAFEEERFDKANAELTEVTLFVSRIMVFLMPLMLLIMNGTMLLIVWVGAHEIAGATMQVGDMMAFIQYAIQIIMAFLMISMTFIFIPRASVAANRINEVLLTDNSVKEPLKAVRLDSKKQIKVVFDQVSFCYPEAEEPALQNISFIVEPGQTVAIIGSTGAGKTTLINLILRLYDVTEGQIRLNGQAIEQLALHDLREIVSYVPQKSLLFKGSIESNLKFGKQDADSVLLEKALRMAQIFDYVKEQPEGVQAPIAQAGKNVSGGQRQRLSIARALVKQTPIYLFDDSFSALDFATEKALRQAIQEEAGDSTVFLVTQRVASIRHADKILVLDEGCLVGQGRHDELMKECSTYREIAFSQLSEEELA